MNFAPIRQAIYTWINNESNITIVWLDQGQPRPAKPYVGIKIVAGPKQKGDDEERLDPANPGVITIQGQRQLTLSVNVYTEVELSNSSTTALDYASTIHDSIGKYTVGSLLRAAGLSILNIGDVQDFSGLLDTRFERRARFDVEFGAVATVTDSPGYFGTVNYTNNGSSGNVQG